jgi:hypothetical protein
MPSQPVVARDGALLIRDVRRKRTGRDTVSSCGHRNPDADNALLFRLRAAVIGP